MLKLKYQFKNYNWVLVIVVLALSCLGVLFINSADSSYTSRQFLGLVVCAAVMIFLSLVNYNYIAGFARILYVLNLVLLALVLVAGSSAGGARRWLNLGVTNFQPSEFCKIILILFVAVYIQEHEEDFNTWRVLLRLAVLCLIPIVMVAAEPDLSTTMDIVLILLVMIFVGGLKRKIITRALLIIIPVSIAFLLYIQLPNQVLLQPYQVTRIMTFFNPSAYSDTTAYQQENSEMAIGSGQLYGKGLNNNTISDVDVTVTDTGLVSEQQTDFIFSVIGEEVGFVGSVIVIALLAIIVLQCLLIAHRAKNMSGRLIAAGVGTLIGFQSFINIGVATYILPNTGLPLPFVSYGLTSLLSCMIGMGLVLNVGLQRHY